MPFTTILKYKTRTILQSINHGKAKQYNEVYSDYIFVTYSTPIYTTVRLSNKCIGELF